MGLERTNPTHLPLTKNLEPWVVTNCEESARFTVLVGTVAELKRAQVNNERAFVSCIVAYVP